MSVFEHQLRGEGVPAPERKADIRASRERIKAASELFEQHFDKAGKPTTKMGERLFEKYYVPDYGESYKFSPKLRWRIKIWIRAVIRRIWRWISPPMCSHCKERIDGMVMGVSINFLSNMWYHYECYQEVHNRPKK